MALLTIRPEPRRSEPRLGGWGRRAFPPSVAIVAIVATSSSLQWGRGFSAAESDVQLVAPTNQYVLKWGRGSSAAESPQFDADEILFYELQWGRGFSAAER